MDSWKRLDGILLLYKEYFYINLNMEYITNADYKHAKNVWKIFETKILCYYHDLHIQSNTLLVADVFEIF